MRFSVERIYRIKRDLTVLGQNCICSEVKQIPSGLWLIKFDMYVIKLTDLENSTLKVDKEIKLLIGADVGGKIIPLKSNPTAVHTRLGWAVMGNLFGSEPSVENVLGITGTAHHQTAKDLEEETTNYFNETLSKKGEGRYEVSLPWVADNFSLPEKGKLAEKGLMSTKRKLMASGKLDDYGVVFDNWLNLGIIEKIPQGEIGGAHYLPHRPVIKSGSPTRIRPVFNASSHVLGSPSLNDCSSTGPNLIEIIPTILNRFRRNYIGVMSDIEKVFLQISIREKDRDYLRFLWLGKDDLERVQEYRHRRVVFVLICSPYLLAATLQYHLTKVEENLSYTSEILKTAFYVDNCVTSLDFELEMRKFILESQIIMSSGNFNLRGILPKDHVRDAATFEIVGVDLAGPLYLKHGPKAYLVLYTCAFYRAIHLELITFLATKAIFQSLRRFISRRRRPTTIYSDNGTDFKEAERLLHVLVWDSILARIAKEKNQWKVKLPSASWCGGWWERLV
ncbi:integrase catalytic domain-containing protein [Trichonephila clavipes]|nr:integrase catalytic domain-containing protein [Trichonephila clavipes]